MVCFCVLSEKLAPQCNNTLSQDETLTADTLRHQVQSMLTSDPRGDRSGCAHSPVCSGDVGVSTNHLRNNSIYVPHAKSCPGVLLSYSASSRSLPMGPPSWGSHYLFLHFYSRRLSQKRYLAWVTSFKKNDASATEFLTSRSKAVWSFSYCGSTDTVLCLSSRPVHEVLPFHIHPLPLPLSLPAIHSSRLLIKIIFSLSK